MKNITTKLHCAFVQADLIWQDTTANLNNFEQKIQHIEHADLIILPELFSTGFCFDTHLAESMTGKTVQWMLHLALKKIRHSWAVS
ncbi:nitrilase-related carbon-nitrogen hydrolase [Aquimarina agarivorans]|uniref:nitrilase-related carbon-nitrogen hydrolase n=1 Tax=Aquimarina agarivorans TaxID=980584 RepID=UPI0002E69DDF|nr:nitrilase-related carbon-nitrogen hydrolase [Aquimarina agarivorans]